MASLNLPEIASTSASNILAGTSKILQQKRLAEEAGLDSLLKSIDLERKNRAELRAIEGATRQEQRLKLAEFNTQLAINRDARDAERHVYDIKLKNLAKRQAELNIEKTSQELSRQSMNFLIESSEKNENLFKLLSSDNPTFTRDQYLSYLKEGHKRDPKTYGRLLEVESDKNKQNKSMAFSAISNNPEYAAIARTVYGDDPSKFIEGFSKYWDEAKRSQVSFHKAMGRTGKPDLDSIAFDTRVGFRAAMANFMKREFDRTHASGLDPVDRIVAHQKIDFAAMGIKTDDRGALLPPHLQSPEALETLRGLQEYESHAAQARKKNPEKYTPSGGQLLSVGLNFKPQMQSAMENIQHEYVMGFEKFRTELLSKDASLRSVDVRPIYAMNFLSKHESDIPPEMMPFVMQTIKEFGGNELNLSQKTRDALNQNRRSGAALYSQALKKGVEEGLNLEEAKQRAGEIALGFKPSQSDLVDLQRQSDELHGFEGTEERIARQTLKNQERYKESLDTFKGSFFSRKSTENIDEAIKNLIVKLDSDITIGKVGKAEIKSWAESLEDDLAGEIEDSQLQKLIEDLVVLYNRAK